MRPLGNSLFDFKMIKIEAISSIANFIRDLESDVVQDPDGIPLMRFASINMHLVLSGPAQALMRTFLEDLWELLSRPQVLNQLLATTGLSNYRFQLLPLSYGGGFRKRLCVLKQGYVRLRIF